MANALPVEIVEELYKEKTFIGHVLLKYVLDNNIKLLKYLRDIPEERIKNIINNFIESKLEILCSIQEHVISKKTE